MKALEETQGSRVVVVSSGGMYNGKFPSWDKATSRDSDIAYDGNMAYVYCKRGQVLLCERWAEAHPMGPTFVTCHPGWTNTPAVDAAYGEDKKYLEPMRTPWQGADGICWLCVAPSSELESGGFYLDREPCVKHMAGPFFSEGSFTKNTCAEVDEMMDNLAIWSNAATRPPPLTEEEAAEAEARKHPLIEMSRPIDLEKFMGRWYVVAGIPSYFEKGQMNSIEDYHFNEKKQRVEIAFRMQSSPTAKPTKVLQRGTVSNKATKTRWSLSPKFGVYLPLGLAYLVIECAEDYSACIVGVPDRAYLWIMARSPTIDESTLQGLVDKSVRCGYDASKIVRIAHDYTSGVPEFAFEKNESASASASPLAEMDS
jgi:lipocalin